MSNLLPIDEQSDEQWYTEELRRAGAIIANLRDQHAAEMRAIERVVGALIAAAGGSIVVEDEHLRESYVLTRIESPYGGTIFKAERL